MNKSDYIELATSLAREAGVEDGVHGYFRLHQDRLWQTVEHLQLLNLRGARVLEVGPFYSYTPFVFKLGGCDVSVIEGEEPVVAPLKPVYARHGIHTVFGNLFDWFGGTANCTGRLPFEDGQFDAVVCFETMEHFPFNPVPFVRDLHRVLRPGGRVFITVPNQAKLDKRLALLGGRSVLPPCRRITSSPGSRSMASIGGNTPSPNWWNCSARCSRWNRRVTCRRSKPAPMRTGGESSSAPSRGTLPAACPASLRSARW